MNSQLREALNTIIDVQNLSGLNTKRDMLISHKNCDTLKDILYFVYNPYIRTGIGWSKLNKNTNKDLEYFDKDSTIQGTFTYLLHNNTGRDIDIARIIGFIFNQTEDEIQSEYFVNVLSNIFTKSLKLGVSTTTFNKIWPGLIPGFGVQLACKWQDNIDMLKGEEIFLTEKLDGNRCFAQVKNNNVVFYSRSGREIEGMEDVKKDLSTLSDGWYDGELLAKSFEQTQSTLRKKGNKKDLVFNVFDYVSDIEVQNQLGEVDYRHRRLFLNEVFEHKELTSVKLVPLAGVGKFSEEWVLSVLDDYVSGGSEGLMINLNVPYQFNRTNQLLKVKRMNTIDLKVVGIQEGRGEFAGTCGALMVEYKGELVGVGSGIDKLQRINFWNNRDKIIGKIVEIQYFEESHDQFGKVSLRFPVFKAIRTDKNEESYN